MGTHIRESLLRGGLRLLHAFDRRTPDPTRLGTDSIQRILAVSSTAIGDTLLSTPALRSLRLAYPQAKISLLLNQRYTALFENNPDIDEIIPYAGGYRRFFRLAWKLRQQRFDVVVILHGNEPQATPLAYLSGADFRFKLPNNNSFRFLLSNTDATQGWDDFTHGIDQRLATAALAGGAPTDHQMTLPVSADADAAFKDRLSVKGIAPETRLVGFQAGASTLSRRWSADNFVALAKRLLARDPALRIVLTGSPDERPLAEKIGSQLPPESVWNAAGELPLIELPALMQRLALLVTGDTGPMHLAVAVGTPVIALFAVSDWQRSGPPMDAPSRRHFVIQKWKTCDPCLSKRCPYAEPICIANISVAEVESAVIASLAGEPGTISQTRAPGETT